MRIWLAIAVLLLFPAQAIAYDLPELAAMTKPSVVLLTLWSASEEKLATGTGFFVSKAGLIVTNHHVVVGGTRVAATLSDGREIKVVGVLAWDAARDVAILQAEEGAEYPSLSLGDSVAVRPGDEVVVIGSPLGLSGTVSAGIVSAIREKGLTLPEDLPTPRRPHVGRLEPTTEGWGIQITAAISAGSSGSPVMTRQGEVIAVAVGTRLDGQSVNFGVPIQVAKDLLGGLDTKVAPRPLSVLEDKASPSEVLTNLGISAAAFAGVALVFFVVGRAKGGKKRPGPRRN